MPERPPVLTARLDRVVAAADERQLRVMAEVGSRLALAARDLTEPEVTAAVGALLGGRFGESPERQALKALVERLDRAAFDLGDVAADDDASEADYASAFTTARAAAAIWFALDADARTAAKESLYEALAAVEDQDVIEQAVLAAIEGQSS